MESNRKRISGTLSLINRLNQLQAAVSFWAKIGLGMVTVIHVTGVYYLLFHQHGAGYALPYLKNFTFEMLTCNRVVVFIKSVPSMIDGYQSLLDLFDRDALTVEAINNFIHTDKAFIQLHIFTGIWLVLITVIAFNVARSERTRQTKTAFIRGAQLFSVSKLASMIRKEFGPGWIYIGKLLIPRKMENLSFICVGKPQQGKTIWINTVLTEINRRNERAIVFCAKAEDFLTTHMLDSDSIFCPLDLRHLENHGNGWSLKNDIHSVEDFSLISKILVPFNAQAKDPLWFKGEVMAVEGLLMYWHLETDRSNKALGEIAKMTQVQMANILKIMPECTDAYGLLANTKSNTSYSFYVSIIADLRPLSLLAKTEGSFSISEWLANENGGKIFIPMNDRAEAMLAPLYAVFIELVMRNHMELPQDRNRRIWYLLDELPNLPKLSLVKLLSKAPSYGAACVCGTQSLAQLDDIYTENGRRSIMNACATSLIYAIEDDKTADEMSKRIGIADVEKASENMSTAPTESKDSITSMLKIDKENCVSADEIRNLKPKNLYVRIAGFGSARIVLKYIEYKQTRPATIPNPIYSLEAFEAEHKLLIEAAKEKIIEIEKEPETTKEADHLFEDDDDLMQQAAQLIQDNDMDD